MVGEIQPQLKYSIEKDFKEKLKIYFMCVKSLPQNPIQVEKFIGVIAYRAEDAFARARTDFGDPGLIIISHSDCALIEDIFRQVNTVEIKMSDIKNPTELQKQVQKLTKIMAYDNFKNSLLLTADELIKDGEDKIQLKNIIKKI